MNRLPTIPRQAGKSLLAIARATAELLDAPLHAVGRAAVDDIGDLTLRARVVPWNVAGRVSDDGRRDYIETWHPGSLVPDARVVVYDPHRPGGGGSDGLGNRTPIGRATDFVEETDGLYATLNLANTPRGREVYELARVLGELDVSLEAVVPITPAGRNRMSRTSAEPCPLTGIAVILPPGRGAFDGAVAVAAGRSDASTTGDDDDQDDDDGTDGDGEGAGSDTSDATAGRAQVAELVRREVARYGLRAGRHPSAGGGPFARFESFPQLVEAARASRSNELSRTFSGAYHAWRDLNRLAATGTVGRALVDQITADNPGLMPPSWLTEVFGIVDQGRPGITALGGPADAGDSGMDIYWPYYDGDLLAIVAQQLAEKSAVNSVKVSFKRGQATLDTYAGGSDVSYQLIRRSSPSYLALYDRILQIAYGLETEYAFDVDLGAGAGGAGAYDLGADADGAGLRAALFEASHDVRLATGEPASVVLAASDVFVKLGGQAWLQPPQYGTQNVAGVSSAGTLRINVSGLEVTEAPGLAAGTMIVSNPGAARWVEEGPFLVSAEDVEKLGTNVAIWGMGTSGLFVPSGIVKITVTMPAPAGAAVAKSSK